MALRDLFFVLAVAGSCSVMAVEKKTKPQPIEPENLRDRAALELQPKDSGITTTPSIMLPLHDEYVPTKTRQWNWSFETRLLTQKLQVVRPADSYGTTNLSDLGTMPFFGFSGGVEKTFFGSHWGVNLITEMTNKRSSFDPAAGPSIPVQIQYFAYGLEPKWSYIFSRWLGVSASYIYQFVNVTQTSPSSSLASWSRAYVERGGRLAADFYLSQARDRRTRVSLAYDLRSSEFGRSGIWSLAYGASW